VFAAGCSYNDRPGRQLTTDRSAAIRIIPSYTGYYSLSIADDDYSPLASTLQNQSLYWSRSQAG